MGNKKTGWAQRLIGIVGRCLPAAALLILAACSHTSQANIVEAGPNGSKPIAVGVAKVTRENLSQELVLSAEFRPYQEINVHAKVAGYVKEIYVDVGDRVKKGQLLAMLEIPELKDDLAHAMATTRRMEEELTRAQSELQRSESAHEEAHLSYSRLASVLKVRPNLVAQQEVDQASVRDRVAEAQVATDRAALAVKKQLIQESKTTEDKIKTLMAYSRISAPFSGIITSRFANTGAMIQAGTASTTQAMPLVRLSQIDRLRLVSPVPVAVVSQIHIGEPVEVKVQALDKSFEGAISRFSRKVDTSTRTMETEVDVPNPHLLLMPGMYASAVLKLDKKLDALAVPVQAVSGHGGTPTVLVVNEYKQLEERQVKLGTETATMVEVLSGLEENNLVVVGSRSQLKSGQAVEPRLIDATEVKGNH